MASSAPEPVVVEPFTEPELALEDTLCPSPTLDEHGHHQPGALTKAGRFAALRVRSLSLHVKGVVDPSGYTATFFVKVLDPAVLLLCTRMLNEHRPRYAIRSRRHPHSFRIENVSLDDATMVAFCQTLSETLARAQKQLAFLLK